MEDEFPNHSTYSLGGYDVTTTDDIRSFAASWPTLLQLKNVENVGGFAFQCRDHLEIWLRTIGSDRQTRPFLVSVSDKAGNPVMMIPLGVEKRSGIRFLGFLDGGVVDYNAPVLFGPASVLSEADFIALWNRICRLAPDHDVVELCKVPKHVGEAPNPFYKLAGNPWSASGYYLPLKEERQRNTYSADNRRQRKRISEIGHLKFKIAQQQSEIDHVFNIFVRQKSRRYEETGANNGLADPAKRAYYSTLAQRLSHGNGVQLSYLCVNNDIIATHWGLVAGRRFYYLMPAYEAGDWRRYSPGRLLLEELIAWSSANEIEVFDFGIGDEDYKLKWAAQPIALSGGLFPRTIIGNAYCAAMRTRGALKRHLPPGVIRAVRSLKGKPHRS